MAKLRKSISIAAPVDQVFEYIADPRHLPEFWPSMVAIQNVETRADGASSFDWIYKLAGLKLHGHSVPVNFQHNTCQVTRSQGGIPNTFRWLFDAHGDSTDVTVDVDYEMPLVGFIAAKLNAREAETLLRNLKVKMEASAVKPA